MNIKAKETLIREQNIHLQTALVSERQLKLGFYDSGLGGFSAVRSCLEKYPAAHILYFADTAYCPLGVKPIELIRARVNFVMKYFHQMGTDYNFIACNTATVHGLLSRKNSCRKTRGTIRVACQDANNQLKQVANPRVLVLATTKTIESQAYQSRLSAILPNISIDAIAADELVQIVEGGSMGETERRATVARVLSKRKLYDYHACVLGCTHFPFLADDIRAVLNSFGSRTVKLIDPAEQMFVGLTVPTSKQTQASRCSLVYSGYRPNFDIIDSLNFQRVDETCLPAQQVVSLNS